MTDTPITIAAQATEVELHAMALRSLLERAEAKEIKRSDPDVERLRQRAEAADAAASTLREIARRQDARAGRVA